MGLRLARFQPSWLFRFSWATRGSLIRLWLMWPPVRLGNLTEATPEVCHGGIYYFWFRMYRHNLS
jgi:hypothetical protein